MLTILFYFLSMTYEKLTFPFVINKDNSSFYERNMETNMTTNISVGMPRIIVPLTITLRQYPFCITDIHSNVKKGIPKYTPDRSDTFDEVWGATDIDEEGLFIKGIQVYDNFNFGNENIEFNQFKFILVRNANKNFSGILGLSMYRNEKMKIFGFVHQLKKKNIIKNQTFYFNFDDNQLIIDDFPHLSYSDKYPEEDYRTTRTYSSSTSQFFDIMFSNMTYNKTNYHEIDTIVELNIESELFKGSSNFGKYLSENYFNQSNCEKTIIMNNYYTFVCNDDKAMNNFKDIDFNLKEEEMTFSLIKDDLFKKENEKYFFLMYFNEKEDLIWSLGKNFFIKNMLVFDSDEKVIGYYFKKISNKGNQGYIKILLFGSILLVLILGFLLYYHIKNKPRRRRANELEDDNFDYFTNIDNKEDNGVTLLNK